MKQNNRSRGKESTSARAKVMSYQALKSAERTGTDLVGSVSCPRRISRQSSAAKHEYKCSVGVLQAYPLRYHFTTVYKQSINLIRLLILGTPRWVIRLVRLLLFVVSVFPAFVVFFWHYASCNRIAVCYKEGCKISTSRHFLDVYGGVTGEEDSSNRSRGKPVVIFLTGGAWIIGYKMWGTLLARALVPAGVLVVIPDYRNFPQTNIMGMIEDADAAVQWTLNNCNLFGGDRERVVLVGQSAGAHIGSCLLLSKAIAVAESGSWKASDLRGFVSVSNPCNLVFMKDILHRSGLDRTIVSAMFCDDVERFSPTHMVRSLGMRTQEAGKERLMPPVGVMHGKIDKTVPHDVSVEFAESLADIGVDVTLKLYDGWSHTDPILEAPFVGDHKLHRDVYNLVLLWTFGGCVRDAPSAGINEDAQFDENSRFCRKICPELLVTLGRFFNPF